MPQNIFKLYNMHVSIRYVVCQSLTTPETWPADRHQYHCVLFCGSQSGPLSVNLLLSN